MKAIKENIWDRIFNIVNITLLTCFMLIVLYPLIYIVSASVSDPDLVSTGQVWLLPKGITLEGYIRVLQDPDILTGYKNTIIYTVAGTTLNLFLTLTAGYALSKKFLPGSRALMFIFAFTMYFSGGMIPTYIMIKNLNLLNTYAILIISGAVNTYNLIIAKTFFANGVPKELEEAAHIDGCSVIRTFFTIIIPLSKALIGVLGLYYGISHWNSYFSALIYINDRNKFPLQLVLREILIENQQKAAMLIEDEELALLQQKVANLIKYSVIIVSSVPVLVIYPFLQKYFDKGVMLGSLKG